MADISMCSGVGCPMRNECHRFTAPKNDFWQSWFENIPYKDENGKDVCDSFWDNYEYKQERNVSRENSSDNRR